MNRKFIITVFVVILAMTGCDNSMLADHPVDKMQAKYTVNYITSLLVYMSQSPTSMSGSVIMCSLNNTGNPNVRITLTGMFEDKITYTDSNGNFSFDDIRPGHYFLSAYRQGYEFVPPQQSVTLTAAGANNVKFETMVTWDRKIGGSGWEKAYSIEQANDCGYIVAGYTDSHDIGNLDFYIIKLDMNGSIEWEQRYGGSNSEIAYSVQQSSDGGYVVSGNTYSYGSGSSDYYIIKLNSHGSMVWQKSYGGSEWEEARSIKQTGDDGYIVAGTTGSYGSGVTDYWILRLNSNGNMVPSWNNGKVYGGEWADEAHSIQQTSDSGFVITGNTEVSNDGNIDVNITKLNDSGVVEWSKNYDHGKNDEGNDIQETMDGGYIIAGGSGEAFSNVWILKLNNEGDREWDKTFGGAYADKAYSIRQTKDGGYIVAGSSYSFLTTDNDIYVIKLDEAGNEQWSRTFDDSEGDEDIAYSIRQTSDGGYVITGETTSYNSKKNIWVLKTNSEGNIIL